MQQTDLNIFLQSLRGNQPMIVLAFLMIRTALTIDDLEAATGLHNDTVRSAVKGLASKNLLFVQRGEHGKQIWIPVGSTFFGQLFEQNPKTSDSAYVVVNVESEERKDLLSASTTLKHQNPKTSDSTLTPEQKDCLAALDEAGIRGKKAKQLIKLDWVTAEYVRAHHEAVQKEFWDNPQGMLVYRIEGEEPAPRNLVVAKSKAPAYVQQFRERLHQHDLDDDGESEEEE